LPQPQGRCSAGCVSCGAASLTARRSPPKVKPFDARGADDLFRGVARASSGSKTDPDLAGGHEDASNRDACSKTVPQLANQWKRCSGYSQWVSREGTRNIFASESGTSLPSAASVLPAASTTATASRDQFVPSLHMASREFHQSPLHRQQNLRVHAFLVIEVWAVVKTNCAIRQDFLGVDRQLSAHGRRGRRAALCPGACELT